MGRARSWWILAGLWSLVGCSFGWDALDPRLNADDTGGASSSSNTGGAGATGGATTTGGAGGTGGVGGAGAMGGLGGTGGTGGMSTGGGGATPTLVNAGLTVRYYMDEAASGQAPAQLLDAASNPWDLPLTYSANMAYDEVGGQRGLSFVMAEQTGDARDAFAGSKVAALAGSTTATIEVVVDVAAVGTVKLAYLDQITGPSSHTGSLSLGIIQGSGHTFLNWHQGVRIGRWPTVVGLGRVVLHAVLDTTEAAAADRVRLYVDGSVVALNGGTPPMLGEVIDFTADDAFIVGNGRSPDNSIQGTLHYLAIYGQALNAGQVTQNAQLLQADDDSP